MDRKGGRERGPSFDNESINLGIYIYIYIYGYWMYPFSGKYFSARERSVKIRFFRIFFRTIVAPFFLFPEKYSRFIFTIPSYESRVLLLSIRIIIRVRKRKKGEKIIRVRETRLFETLRNSLDRANEGSRVVFEIESGSASRRYTPDLLLVYRNSIRRGFLVLGRVLETISSSRPSPPHEFSSKIAES